MHELMSPSGPCSASQSSVITSTSQVSSGNSRLLDPVQWAITGPHAGVDFTKSWMHVLISLCWGRWAAQVLSKLARSQDKSSRLNVGTAAGRHCCAAAESGAKQVSIGSPLLTQVLKSVRTTVQSRLRSRLKVAGAADAARRKEKTVRAQVRIIVQRRTGQGRDSEGSDGD